MTELPTLVGLSGWSLLSLCKFLGFKSCERRKHKLREPNPSRSVGKWRIKDVRRTTTYPTVIILIRK